MAQFESESRQALYSDILAQDDRTPFATVFDWEA